MKITVDMIMSHVPCDDWPRERVKDVIGDGLTAREVADSEITLQDKHWVLWHCLPDTDAVLEAAVVRGLNFDHVVQFAKHHPKYAKWRTNWLDGTNRDELVSLFAMSYAWKQGSVAAKNVAFAASEMMNTRKWSAAGSIIDASRTGWYSFHEAKRQIVDLVAAAEGEGDE